MSVGPVRIVDLELTDPLPASLDSDHVGGLLVVLRISGRPVGQLDLPASALPVTGSALSSLVAQEITDAVGQRLLGPWFDAWLPEIRPSHPRAGPPRASEAVRLGAPLVAMAAAPTAPPQAGAPTVSVVVCTRHRADQLQGTMAALDRLVTAPHEILVVDNSEGDRATRDVVAQFPSVRYVCEPRPGLSAARNTGVRATTGEVIAFTDDDVRPAPTWLAELLPCFDTADVGVVTGLVLPASLRSEGALLFERGFGGFGAGYRPKRFDRAFLQGMRRHTPPVWKIGAGANMAVRRRVLDLVGLFDERLGAGAAGCSEDSELWYRVLAAGFACQYAPSAVVAHEHRPDLAGVRAQLGAYMRGHVTALGIQLTRHRQAGELRRATANLPAHYGKRAIRRVVQGTADPTLGAEARGWATGLLGLPRALREQSRTGAPPRDRRAFLAQNPYPHPWTEGLFFREKMRAIHRVAPHDAVRRVLEVGGGQSGLSSALFPDAVVVSVDLDPAYGGSAMNRRRRQSFLAADACRLPFADGTFDVVTFFDVLEHIPDHARAVQEAQRVLAPGGSLLVTAPNDAWRFPYHRGLAPLCPSDLDVMAQWGHVRRGYSDDDLSQLVGRPPLAVATFINPVTAVAHDLGFARLPGPVRRALIGVLLPVVLPAYVLHRPGWKGTESAWWWRTPLTS